MPQLIRADGTTINYEVHGAGPIVMVLGGWGMLTKQRFTSLPALWRDEFRIVVCDYPGLGDSDFWHPALDTREFAEGFGAVLDEVLGEVGADRCAAVLGLGGLGAAVAQHLAGLRGDMIDRVVLSSGWAGPEPYHDAQLRAMTAVRESCTFDQFVEFVATLCYLPEHINEGIDLPFPNWRGPANVEGRKDAHLALMHANLTHDATAVLPGLTQQALIVCGEYDLLGGPRLARTLSDLIPVSRTLVLPDTPHVYASVPDSNAHFHRSVVQFVIDG